MRAYDAVNRRYVEVADNARDRKRIRHLPDCERAQGDTCRCADVDPAKEPAR